MSIKKQFGCVSWKGPVFNPWICPRQNMKRFHDFIDFNAEEFAANESFQFYVFKRKEDDIAFWEEFVSRHPEKLADIREATELLITLRFKHGKVKGQQKQAELDKLLAALPASSIQERHFRRNTNQFSLYQRISQGFRKIGTTRFAATACVAIVILCMVIFGVSLLTPSTVIYKTSFGENKTYILPDSSVVILNGNSRLVHSADWKPNTTREVWLDGEGFFEVKHLGATAQSRFIVHTAGMDVEVLGTKFNVFNRNDKVNVVLNSGKVKVTIASSADTSAVVMMPDEALEFSRKDLTVTKRQVKAEVLTSWRNRVLVFENTPLSRIGEIIEYTYGLKVVFRENVDATEELAGTVPCENLEVLLDVLAKSSNLNITRENDQIIIAKRE